MAVCLLVEEIRSKRGKPTDLTKVADKLHMKSCMENMSTQAESNYDTK